MAMGGTIEVSEILDTAHRRGSLLIVAMDHRELFDRTLFGVRDDRPTW